MIRTYKSEQHALDVAKEAVWLAWQACKGPLGLGIFQDRGPHQDREAVWNHAYNELDYRDGRKQTDETDVPIKIDCDYVMGRMMKLRFKIHKNMLIIPDSDVRIDYQAWCCQYKSYVELFNTAEKNLGVTTV
jgi:hypothetical protein